MGRVGARPPPWLSCSYFYIAAIGQRPCELLVGPRRRHVSQAVEELY